MAWVGCILLLWCNVRLWRVRDVNHSLDIRCMLISEIRLVLLMHSQDPKYLKNYIN